MLKKYALSLSLVFICHTYAQNTPDIAAILKRIEDDKIKFVNFMFSDLNGNPKEVIIPACQIQSALEDNLMFDGSSIPGCRNIAASDTILKADHNTFGIIPWTKSKIKSARLICDMYETEEKPFFGDPRYVLKKTLEQARAMGYDFYVGPEIEFFLLKQNKDGQLVPCDQNCYFNAETNIWMQNFTRKLLNALLESNINVEKLHHEVAPGQFEVVIKYSNALDMADQVILAKHIIATIAENNDLFATFMPKPLFGQNGSGMHMHFSLFDITHSCNAFYDENDPYNLSQTAKYFMAGVLNHVREITAILNQTVNSYKRLVPGYEAPTNICWGTKNRSVLIRLPQIKQDCAAAVRAEIRCPDPSTNPYLAFAALLKAGLTGIQNQELLPEAMEESVYRLSPEQLLQRGILSLPGSLEEALELLENSPLCHELLGEQMLTEFVAQKNREVQATHTSVTDWEHDQYL